MVRFQVTSMKTEPTPPKWTKWLDSAREIKVVKEAERMGIIMITSTQFGGPDEEDTETVVQEAHEV